MMKSITCDYCGAQAPLVSGDVIYPHRRDLFSKRFYSCEPCGAYVGCHAGAKCIPLGRVANAELRKAKQHAHLFFDQLWRGGTMKRKAAYAWLAEKLAIDVNKTHIGMFDVGTCERVAFICKRKLIGLED